MKQAKKIIPAFISAICFLILIVDTQTAIEGAQDGLELCVKTLIPSLFPFFVVSSLFCMYCSNLNSTYLTPILRPCNIKSNASSLLIIGLIGGYPTGAKAISDAYDRGVLSLSQARRMLGFCNNAGPAFIFGMLGSSFRNPIACFILQLILIISSLITGIVLPGKSIEHEGMPSAPNTKNKNLLESNMKAMASVCSWVVLFRVIINFFKKWFLWMLPNELAIALTGTLELTNACISLNSISNEGLRFIIATGILSLGGLCVYMQTAAVTQNIGTGLYFPGKILQLSIATTLAIIAQNLLFTQRNIPICFVSIPIIIFVAQYMLIKIYYKKTVAFSNIVVYNNRKKSAEAHHAVS